MRTQMRMYNAGLEKSPYGRKFAWRIVKNVDALSPEVYEFEKIRAPNQRVAVNMLNKKYQSKYGSKLRKSPMPSGDIWY